MVCLRVGEEKTAVRPADRHAPRNHVRVREFIKQKATFFILCTPPFDFVGIYEARSLSRKLVNMSLLALRFDNFEFGVEYATLLALRLSNFHLRSDGRLSVCILCRRHVYWGVPPPCGTHFFNSCTRGVLISYILRKIKSPAGHSRAPAKIVNKIRFGPFS